jgi:hypothetical protein
MFRSVAEATPDPSCSCPMLLSSFAKQSARSFPSDPATRVKRAPRMVSSSIVKPRLWPAVYTPLLAHATGPRNEAVEVARQGFGRFERFTRCSSR